MQAMQGSMATMDDGGGTVLIPRWLTGGIPAANCKAAYEPMDAVSQTTSYGNLANLGTNDITVGLAPTWATGTGWQFNRTGGQYLRTGLNPGGTWSAIVRFSGAEIVAGAYQLLLGCTDAASTNRFGISPTYDNSGGGRRLYLHASAIIVASTQLSGVMAICGTKAFFNGAQEPGTMTGGAAPGYELLIGAYNIAGTPSYFIKANVQRMYVYDIDISSYMTGLTTAINS